jgi:hypothetical protein
VHPTFDLAQEILAQRGEAPKKAGSPSDYHLTGKTDLPGVQALLQYVGTNAVGRNRTYRNARHPDPAELGGHAVGPTERSANRQQQGGSRLSTSSGLEVTAYEPVHHGRDLQFLAATRPRAARRSLVCDGLPAQAVDRRGCLRHVGQRWPAPRPRWR